MPIISPEIGLTKPDAGVTVASPAIEPVTTPKTVGLPLRIHSKNAQVKPAHAAAAFVVTKALMAKPLAAKALPALKPNHPNQSNDVPKTTKGKLCGAGTLWSRFFLLPMIKVTANAAIPADVCTTIPPAKSSTPKLRSHPPTPQTQWHIGA